LLSSADWEDAKEYISELLEEPDLPFYYELSTLRLERIPKRDRIISALRERGFVAGRTTFSKTGIKSDAPMGEFILRITDLTK